ncbi:phosphate ABC transporter substrate-binding protein [Vibrio sp. SCSIO 43136]|uniref:phosphate ABC transporter substrate-binding protein n=1 Tax=Vibrio sp. SCSIO 43136 TaxID=2819101 RepID=UPI002075CECB|nr:phosphate ABC transporter substrate-binding protein [Vibrio sp. SCSIO 43136]USD68089.1 phosphate ABC transporter substrate-binding protein [Vibrio sp. SCSIO 43136]
MKKIMTLLVAATLSFGANAGMVVIGNAGGVDSLSKADVKKLFMGKKTKLKNGTKAQIVELAAGSADKAAFHDQATGRNDSQLQSAWSRLVFTGKAEAPIEVADFPSVIAEVSSNPAAIGYVDEANLTGDVKVLYKF